MATRLVPSQFPTIAAAIAASANGDVIELGLGYSSENATVTVFGLTITGGTLNTGIVLSLAPGIAAVTLGGTAPINVFTSDGTSVVIGNGGANQITGGAAADLLIGGDGNDTLIGGMGADTLDGAAGVDTINYAAAGSLVNVSLYERRAVGGAGNDELISIENVTGSAFDDVLFGNEVANTLLGGAGNDLLDGREGDDTIDGGAGDDVLLGALGHDTLIGGPGNDTANYAAAPSAIFVYLNSTPGNNNLWGVDTIIQVENVIGTPFNDSITGTADDNILVGGGGQDTLAGGYGTDFLYGGSGDDTLFTGNGSDLLDGGDGNDTVRYTGDTGTGVNVALFLGSSVTFGTNFETYVSIEHVIGTQFADHILGTSGTNILLGQAGNDRLEGREGDDSLDGQEGDDLLYGGAGEDVINGGGGVDTVSYADAPSGVNVALFLGNTTTFGGGFDRYLSIENVVGSAFGDHLLGDAGANRIGGRDGSDQMEGREGADLLEGENGDDILIGGAGADMLLGGAGADRFAFTGLTDSTSAARDRIYDFDRAVDLIDLSALDADSVAAGDQAFTLVGAFSGGRGQATLAPDGATGNTLLTLDFDGDGTGDFFLFINGLQTGSSGFLW